MYVFSTRQRTDSSNDELTLRKANVLRLLHVSSNLQPAFPAVFCVYNPLALASLEDLMKSYVLTIAAQVALLIEYLRGLVHLHDSKGIMHRDIKPNNLGVLSFSPFNGVILDLDAATTETLSDDHKEGTISYLAPEVIDLKMGTTKNLEKYGLSVDVWGLGMSFFFVLMGKHVMWNDFDDGWTKGVRLPKTNVTNFVLEGRLLRFHESIGKLKAKSDERRRYVNLLESMTAYKHAARVSASRALNIAEDLAIDLVRRGEEAKMASRHSTQGIKRKFGEN